MLLSSSSHGEQTAAEALADAGEQIRDLIVARSLAWLTCLVPGKLRLAATVIGIRLAGYSFDRR